MNSTLPVFRAPSGVERAFNQAFGFVIGLGLGFRYNFLLEVRGRKTGRIYSTPINLLELDGKKYLVAPRGRAQWMRNAEASGQVSLKKGRARLTFRLRPLGNAEKPSVLKAYGAVHERGSKIFPNSSRIACRSVPGNCSELSALELVSI